MHINGMNIILHACQPFEFHFCKRMWCQQLVTRNKIIRILCACILQRLLLHAMWSNL